VFDKIDGIRHPRQRGVASPHYIDIVQVYTSHSQF